VPDYRKTNKRKSSSSRLFLGLWPDDNERRQVKKLQDKIGLDAGLNTASVVKLENLHITLHFLGDVNKSDTLMLLASLDKVSSGPVDLTLDKFGYFSKPKILWIGCTEAPQALFELVKSTKCCVRSVMKNYHQKNFIPHITLFRKASRLPELREMPHINLKFDSFALIESSMHPEGVKYSLLQEWSLE
jgi:2'-5' RNA ligase